MQEDDSTTTRVATITVVGVFGLGAPVIAAMAESIRPHSQPITPALYVANYLAVLSGFVAGCICQASVRKGQKRVSTLIACILICVLSVGSGVLITAWAESMLNVNSSSICGLVGLVCGSMFWEMKIKTSKAHRAQ